MNAPDEPTGVEQAIELALLLHMANRRQQQIYLPGSMWIYEMAGTGTEGEAEAATRALDNLLRNGLVCEEGELIIPTEAALDFLGLSS